MQLLEICKFNMRPLQVLKDVEGVWVEVPPETTEEVCQVNGVGGKLRKAQRVKGVLQLE